MDRRAFFKAAGAAGALGAGSAALGAVSGASKRYSHMAELDRAAGPGWTYVKLPGRSVDTVLFKSDDGYRFVTRIQRARNDRPLGYSPEASRAELETSGDNLRATMRQHLKRLKRASESNF